MRANLLAHARGQTQRRPTIPPQVGPLPLTVYAHQRRGLRLWLALAGHHIPQRSVTRRWHAPATQAHSAVLSALSYCLTLHCCWRLCSLCLVVQNHTKQMESPLPLPPDASAHGEAEIRKCDGDNRQCMCNVGSLASRCWRQRRSTLGGNWWGRPPARCSQPPPTPVVERRGNEGGVATNLIPPRAAEGDMESSSH